MDRLWAKEMLHDPRNDLGPATIRWLTLKATGSKDKADDAYSDALAAEMRRKSARE